MLNNITTPANLASLTKGLVANIHKILEDNTPETMDIDDLGLFDQVKAHGESIYRTKGVVSIGDMEDYPDLEGHKADTYYPSYETEYKRIPYGKLIIFSREQIKTKDSLFWKNMNATKDLFNRALKHRKEYMWQIFMDALVTTDSKPKVKPIFRLDDGVAMVSASHPSKVPGVSNRSNLMSGNPEYSRANLTTAILDLGDSKNGRGEVINYSGAFTVICTPFLRDNVSIDLGTALKPGSGNNDKNVLKDDYEINYKVNPHMNTANGGNDKRWFVVASGLAEGERPFIEVEFDPFTVDVDTNKDTGSVSVMGDGVMAVGYSYWEMIRGSNPA